MISLCTFVVCTFLSVTPPPTPQSIVEQFVFQRPLSVFVREAQSAHHDARLDWSTDGCSAPVVGSTGRSFDFYEACWRHDFAYRNYARINNGALWTSRLRARVDAVFRKDMAQHCATRARSIRTTCRRWSNVFYTAVRTYGSP